MSESKERRKRRRWGDATTETTTSANGNGNGAMDAKAKTAALQQSISARLAALKAKKAQALSSTTAPVMTPAVITAAKTAISVSSGEPPNKKAKVYDLDLSVTAPSFRTPKADEPQPPTKKKFNPYLAHLEQETDNDQKSKSQSTRTLNENDESSEVLLDNRLGVVKPRPRKELRFVEPGTFIHRAERKREKVENATKSGFVSGRKVGNFFKSTGIADIQKSSDDNYYGHTSTATIEDFSTLAKSVPRADTVGESLDGSSKSTAGVVVIPTPLVMEWWDVDLLPGKLKKEVVAKEGKLVKLRASKRMKIKSSQNEQEPISAEEKELMEETRGLIDRCFSAASVAHSKTFKLVQHPVPVKPANAPKEDARASTLHLTKKEMKRQRKLRRAEKQRELQDMQAAGLIEAPEPKLTLSNFMRVLGDQAVMDPSKMEAKVTEQIQARKLKHERMNEDRKLTKEQKAEKRDRKLAEDTSEAVSVALFLVKDMSHTYHRTKVDLNAQQNKITGGVLECEAPRMSLVICEGGPKAIKRYTRLMLVRMKWKGEDVMSVEESDDEDDAMGEDGEEGKEKSQKVSLGIRLFLL